MKCFTAPYRFSMEARQPERRGHYQAAAPEFGAKLLTMERQHPRALRSEEHTSELQSRLHLVCRLPPEKKKRRWGTRPNALKPSYVAVIVLPNCTRRRAGSRAASRLSRRCATGADNCYARADRQTLFWL